MKKISLIVISLVFSIAAVFIFPAKEANANPLVAGGALYLGGAGVYVVGAVAVAGLAGLAGCTSCQEDIEAHAQRTWDGSTQIVKDGLQLMIDASVGLAGGLTAVDQNVNTWVDGQLSKLAGSLVDEKYYYNSVDSGNLTMSYSSGHKTVVAKVADGFYWVSNAYVGNYYAALLVRKSTSSITVLLTSPMYGSADIVIASIDKTIENESIYNAFSAQLSSASTASDLSNLALAIGASFGYANHTEYAADYNNVHTRMIESWEEMTDAGLVLPTDNARPMFNDVPLTYDPVTDTYAGIDGITVPHEDVTGFEYQKPHWKTLDDLAALGLAGLGAGLYIDGWPSAETTTSTYDPATDLTTTVTSTGTTTNVTTGETAITGTTTTTTTGDTTGNPPVNPPTASKPGDPLNPFKAKPMPIAAIMGLFQLLAALIFYLIRLFTFIATIAFIAPTPIDNPYFLWFIDATFYGIKPFPLVQNLALFFLGFSVYRSVRRVFG